MIVCSVFIIVLTSCCLQLSSTTSILWLIFIVSLSEKTQYTLVQSEDPRETQMFKQLHANLWWNSAIVLHSAGQKTHISGLLSFFTWVVKSARKVFITSHHADLFAFAQNQQKKESDSRSRAVHKQRLQALSVRSTEQKMSDGELPGIACWQDRVETRLYARWKGEDIWFVLCSVQMAPASSQMSVKTVSQCSKENTEPIF